MVDDHHDWVLVLEISVFECEWYYDVICDCVCVFLFIVFFICTGTAVSEI